MLTTLYLTDAEKEVFSSLPANLQENWTVESESIGYQETPDKRVARLRLLKLEDESLRELQVKAMQAQSEDELTQIAGTINIESMTQNDVKELFYAMGPDIIGTLLENQLTKAQSPEDVQGLAGISTIRHLLFGPQ